MICRFTDNQHLGYWMLRKLNGMINYLFTNIFTFTLQKLCKPNLYS